MKRLDASIRRRTGETARQLVLLTGLSGSGKGTILKAFEDLGYYCVDNLPVDLIPTFSELSMGGEYPRAALLVDAREGEKLQQLPAMYHRLKKQYPVTLVFVEASDEALLRRFSETRRPHPLAGEGTVAEGIRRERQLMAPIRRLADVVIDTSNFTVHDLRQFVMERFQKAGRRRIQLTLMSFGYRYGIPAEADLVLDVRFLPNPHFQAELRPYSGRDPRVARFLLRIPETTAFLRRIESLLSFLLPRYVREGKSYLTIAIGCTGGRHRSVALVEFLRRRLAAKGYRARVVHRDLERTVG